MRIILATTNPAKQEALRRLLLGLDVQTISLHDFGLPEQSVAEDGPTYRVNALAKATAYALAAGEAAIASDGGLEIPALGNAWDGLRTRRFAGPSDADRLAALLELLRGVPPKRRSARFHEAVAIVAPDGTPVASVECAGPWGRLAEAPDSRASAGFWVPALWQYPPRWVTEWELAEAERGKLTTSWDMVRESLLPALRCYLEAMAC